MKHLSIALGILSLFPLTAVASDHDFDAAVASIETSYHLHRQYVPMIGLASFCAHVATGGAVKGIKIAAFTADSDAEGQAGAALPETSDLPSLLQTTLGASWSLVDDTRSSGEQDAIYARPHGQRMTLLVASYDHGDLSVARLDLNATKFAEWMNDPIHHVRHHETN